MNVAENVLPAIFMLINASLDIVYILVMVALPIGIPAIIVALINNRIGAGRRWARILVGVCLGVALIYIGRQWPVFLGLLQGKIRLSLPRASQLFRLLLSGAAVVLLFTPRSNRWFKARSTADS